MPLDAQQLANDIAGNVRAVTTAQLQAQAAGAGAAAAPVSGDFCFNLA